MTVIGWLHGLTRGLVKPTILLVDNAEDAIQPHAGPPDDAGGAGAADSQSSGLVATLSRLLAAAPADRLRLLLTSRVPVPVQGGAGSFSLEPLSVEEAAGLVSALAPIVSAEDAEAVAAHCGCIPVKICALAIAINVGALSVSDALGSGGGAAAAAATSDSPEPPTDNLRNKDALVAALEAAPAEVRATVEALTVFPTAFDEESAADVLAGAVGTGASSDADAAACKKRLDAAVSAGLLNHDPRNDTYKIGPGR